MIFDLLLGASEPASVWVLGSLMVVCLTSVCALYGWVGGKMDRQEQKFVNRDVCQQVQVTNKVMLQTLQTGQDKICKKVDKIVEHLMGKSIDEPKDNDNA